MQDHGLNQAGKGPALLPRRGHGKRVVAVTGAASFLGRELIRRLEADRRYTKVLAIDLRKPAVPLAKTQHHRIDLTLPSADGDLAALWTREQVDTVVHAAFLSTPTHSATWAHELEVIGTMYVLNACGAARVRKLVLSSTTLCYGARPDNPNFLDERHELRGHPRSRFVTDKLEAERLTQRFAGENRDTVVTILRSAATLGPTIGNFASRFFARPVCPVLMGYDPLLQLLHESDAVDGFELAVRLDRPGAYNLVSPGVLPYSTILALMGRLPLPMPTFFAYPLSRALWLTQAFDSPPSFLDLLRYLCVADGAKAERELGFRPRYDIRATILDFLGLLPESERPRRALAGEGRA